MTRRQDQVRRPRPAADPYGLGAAGSYGPPIVAGIGLLVAAWLTVGLLTGDFRVPGASGSNGGNSGPVRTPTPSGVVIVGKDESVPGEIVYSKGGNIWIQSGSDVRQLTSSGGDTMPAWSPDGQFVYYIHTVDEPGTYPTNGRPHHYDMAVPNLMRVKADGSGKPQRVTSGKFRTGPYTWFYWIRQPVLSPN